MVTEQYMYCALENGQYLTPINHITIFYIMDAPTKENMGVIVALLSNQNPV